MNISSPARISHLLGSLTAGFCSCAEAHLPSERGNGSFNVADWWTQKREKGKQRSAIPEFLVRGRQIGVVKNRIGVPDVADGAEIGDGKAIQVLCFVAD